MRNPAARPMRGPSGYAFPSTSDRLLSWADAEVRLRDARFYWLATTNPSGTAHVRPLWGVWVDGFYFDGHPHARWARNIARDGRASVNLENAASVLIVEGLAEDEGARVERKPDGRHGVDVRRGRAVNAFVVAYSSEWIAWLRVEHSFVLPASVTVIDVSFRPGGRSCP